MVCDPATSSTAWSPATSGLGCDDGNACTKLDVCTGATCAGEAYVCDDGLSCTEDACDGFGGCLVTQAEASCVIGDDCFAADDVNPQNSCLACLPTVSTVTWSPRPGNAQCDDGLPCTSNDRCTGGSCTGEAYTCDDALACTDNICDGQGGCSYPVIDGNCLIEGGCYAPDQRPDESTCRVCDPAFPKVWSAPTTAISCVDGDDCTANDRCASAVCVGTPYDCDDGLTCTSETCNGDGTCSTTQLANTCLVANACYSPNDPNPNAVCSLCDPTRSPTSFSSAPRQHGL